MRILYKEIYSCKDCPMNKCSMCYELGKPLKSICFERDCPLPTKGIVESFTRYITKDKSIDACGNCAHWSRWNYNRSLETEIGTCDKDDILLFSHCTSPACKSFKEV